jgi:hypothetical protein
MQCGIKPPRRSRPDVRGSSIPARRCRYPTSRSLRLEEAPEGLDCRFRLVWSNQPALFSGADREHDQNLPARARPGQW